MKCLQATIVLLVLQSLYDVVFAQKIKNNCPAADSIKPCLCNPSFDGSCKIRCYAVGMAALTNLTAIPNLCKGHVHLTLIHSVVRGIPSKLWQTLLSSKSVDVSLMYSKVEYLIPPEDEPLPILHTPGEAFIKIQHSSSLDKWDWLQLKHFVADDELTLIIDDTPISTLPMSFSQIAGGAVEKVFIDRAQLADIPDGVFKDFDLLYSLSVQGNSLESIRRSMFPQPAAKLRFLHLNGNRFTSLPEDLFSDMPSLEIVYLRENKLTTLPMELFLSINSQSIKTIDLIQNNWHCDCKLRFVLSRAANIPLEMGKCATPDELAGKDVKSSTNELTCS